MMSSFNEVWDGGHYTDINVLMLDEWGLVGLDDGAIIFPRSDVPEGGNSAVIDPNGNYLGFCPPDVASCIENWNIESAIDKYASHVGWDNTFYYDETLLSDLKITDFVPSSQENWGWATAGWWIIPSYDKSFRGETPFDKAKPMGLTSTSWIVLLLSYPKGETLTIQLKSEDVDESDLNQSPPRLAYMGTGSVDRIEFPVIAIKRAGWSNPSTHDPEKVTAIGLLRMEAGLAEGAQFHSYII
ncbi:hypothetical protein OAA91_00645 [Fibrobacterales bacterium]|nr:hypothetical protein [Fibrobacterales bacterium]